MTELLTIMDYDRFDDESVLINFEQIDTDSREVIKQSGYVCVRQGGDRFLVEVFDSDGTVVGSTTVMFNFKEC